MTTGTIVIPPYKSGSKVTEEMLNAISELKANGYSIDDISSMTGVSVFTIKERLKYHNDPEGWAKRRKSKDVSPLLCKIRKFCGVTDSYGEGGRYVFTEEELLAVREPRCYITGIWIDINKPDTYSLDHRIAKAEGGLSVLDNCYFVDSHINIAKWDKPEEELLVLAEKLFKYYVRVKAQNLVSVLKSKLNFS